MPKLSKPTAKSRARLPHRYKDPAAWVRAMQYRTPISEGQQMHIGLAYRIAFDSLLAGRGESNDYVVLGITLNVTMILCERGYAAADMEIADIKLAMQALIECQSQFERTGAWSLGDLAKRSIAHVLDLHDAQINEASQQEILDAIAEMNRRAESGHGMEAV